MSGVFNASTPKKDFYFTPGDSMNMLGNPKQYYTPEFQKILQAKVAKIQSPILIIQGDVDRRAVAINKWNNEVLVPELRAAGKALQVNTYAGQLHCFCIGSGLPWPFAPPPASWPAAAADASREMEAFGRRYLKTQPKQLAPQLVKYVAVHPEMAVPGSYSRF
jgi:hypothetical protein